MWESDVNVTEKSTGTFYQNRIINDWLHNAVFHDMFYTVFVIWDSDYCLLLNQLNLLRFRVIDSPPITRGLHLDPKKNTEYTSVPFHNLQTLNVTVYNHYWTGPAARVHSGSITFGNIDQGCTHENSACSLCVVTSSFEHTVTSMVLKWIRIIGKEGKQTRPHTSALWRPPQIVNEPSTVKSSFLKWHGRFQRAIFICCIFSHLLLPVATFKTNVFFIKIKSALFIEETNPIPWHTGCENYISSNGK